MDFDTTQFGPVLGGLVNDAPLNELGPGATSGTGGLRPPLALMDAAQLIDEPIVDRQMAQCVAAGALLLYDDLGRSHEISQSIDTPSGSYWHGLMHRREPDY